MLAGLAPIADQSGKREGKRVIFGGRARGAPYALSRRPLRRPLQPRYAMPSTDGCALAGKAPKLALIAVARKLAVLANTLISEDRMWRSRAPIYA